MIFSYFISEGRNTPILLSNLVRIIRLAGVIAKEEEEAAVKDAIRQIREKKKKEEE